MDEADLKWKKQVLETEISELINEKIGTFQKETGFHVDEIQAGIRPRRDYQGGGNALVYHEFYVQFRILI